MYSTPVIKLLCLPLCLLVGGALKSAAAQTCADAPCLFSAITAANADAAHKHSINLAEGQVFALASYFPSIEIDARITINGNDSTLDGTGLRSVFFIGLAGNLTLNDVTLTNGTSTCISNNGGAVTLNGSTITGCHGTPFGGGGVVNVAGSLTLNNSTISNNTSSSSGGGILNQATVILNNSAVTGNNAPGALGGGISNSGDLTVNSSTITGNGNLGPAAWGGGIFNLSTGTVTVNKSNITGNAATLGAGIYNFGGTVTIDKKSVVDSVYP